MQQSPGNNVTLDVVGDVARIAFARPERGNAIDLVTAQELRAAIASLGTGASLGAVVLHGEGKNFCVGGDLQSFAEAADPRSFLSELAATAHEALLGLHALQAPVITAVHGACAGAGIGFALAGDIVLASHDVRFRVAYTGAGLSPDCGVSWSLTRTLGPARAADLILTNRMVDAEQAERYGLVSRVSTGDALTDALALAETLATGPRGAFAKSVRLVREAQEAPLPQHLDAEAAGIAALVETAEGQEGIRAFLEHRRPAFAETRAAQPAR
ncbi:enoyl-CoA hydratase/isomerase family protein [Amycolatopsis circi]|uniref:enoyl-CoA hydratase/isomerase family protein n=1 Tax=Amycolatopsis circi TaxID=871959 RepID=UPI001FC9365C|nr:enoyl-CoA hydratase/isomerase family protein [Amycolatopsis circi]